MANHVGGYMLNAVLKKLEAESILEGLGVEEAQRLTVDVVRIGLDYDCREYEILEGIGQRLGICFNCLKPREELRGGLCARCSEELPGYDWE